MKNDKTSKAWFVADPVHNILDVGARHLRDVIPQPIFQRLRRISQLGLASYVFPGAVHTRFSHSLGAAHLATRVTRHLLAVHHDPELKEHAELVQSAALLHDIGHGPFSHSFERAVKKILGKELAPKHEDWTRKIVSERIQNIPSEVRRQIADIIAPASSASRPVPAFVREIVSSQLDVDRMDYLVRDAHYTGVSAGAIDLDYLIQSLRIIRHGTEKTLGITANGLVSYEGFLFGRHCMNRTVYRHRTVATFECMMERFLSRAVSDGSARRRRLPRFLKRLGGTAPRSKEDFVDECLDEYLELTEDLVWALLQDTSDGKGSLAVLARRILGRERVRRRDIAPGRETLLQEQLKKAKLDESCAIVDLGSVLYKQHGDSRVFVMDADEASQARDVSKVSTLVDRFHDRAEAAHLLVLFEREDEIEDLAQDAGCLVPQRGPGLASIRPEAQGARAPKRALAVGSEREVSPVRIANDVEPPRAAMRQRTRGPRRVSSR